MCGCGGGAGGGGVYPNRFVSCQLCICAVSFFLDKLGFYTLLMIDCVFFFFSGAGESGKSTIVKQMRIIHTQGFSSQEKDQMKGSIYSNVHDSSKALAHAATDLGIEIGCQDSASFMLGFSEKYSASEYPPEFFDHAQALWADGTRRKQCKTFFSLFFLVAGIKATYERRNEFQLNDSADYFFNELPRLRDPSYVPTDQDAVRLRVLTTGTVSLATHMTTL